MKNNFTKKIFSLLIIILLVFPLYSNFLYADDLKKDETKLAGSKGLGGLVPCGTDVIKTKDGGGIPANPCDFYYFIDMINIIITFILKLVLPIAAILFAYAGILLLTSGGNSSKKDKAKSLLLNAALGLIIVLGAWLIVKTIINLLGFSTTLI